MGSINIYANEIGNAHFRLAVEGGGEHRRGHRRRHRKGHRGVWERHSWGHREDIGVDIGGHRRASGDIGGNIGGDLERT